MTMLMKGGSSSSEATAFAALGIERYVSLSTFRRSGERVLTPVWIARDGEALVVITSAGSGKVKRVRRDSRVELQPCSRTGRLDSRVRPHAAVAEVVTDERVAWLTTLFRRKYGLEYYVFTSLERLARRGRVTGAILRLTTT